MDRGGYRVREPLGVGGDGASYQADGADGEPVELWVLDRDRIGPVRFEAAAKRVRTSRLTTHPAFLRVIAENLDQPKPTVAVSDPDTVGLIAYQCERVPLPTAEVVAFGLELTGALIEAHRLGLAVGLGPDSVRVRPTGRPLIDPIGLEVRPALGRDDELVRSCRAPESAGDRDRSEAADLYALGGLLQWLETGQAAGSGPALTTETVECSKPALDADEYVCVDRPASWLRAIVGALRARDPAARPSAFETARILVGIGRGLAGDDPESVGVGPTVESNAGGLILREAIDRAGSLGDGEGRQVAFIPKPAVGLGSRLGRYRLVEILGRGGMGAVYRGEDLADGSTVAVKVLRADATGRPGPLQRFRKEARLLSEARSPHIANFLEAHEEDGTAFLVMEYVRGRTLGKLLGEAGALPEPEALRIAADVARALAEAHALGIIHRDVKPDNVMLEELASDSEAHGGDSGFLTVESPRTRVRLTDFGLARHVEESESLQLTDTRAVVGTPHYMAPEQCGGGRVDARTDVYALGVTLYHMLVGKTPFQGASLIDVIGKQVHEPPPPVRSINPAVSDAASAIVARTLAKNPADRYADAGALLDAIERLQRGEPIGIVAHPLLPTTDPDLILAFDFEWELKSPPRRLWPLVSDTERLNRAIGLPAVAFTREPDPETGRVRVRGQASQGGILAEWREHPYEWVEPRRMGVLRSYKRGPFRWMTSAVELEPLPGGGTRLTHRLRIEPRGTLMRMAARLKVGRDSRRSLERVYRRIDEALIGKLGDSGLVDPFEPPSALEPVRRKLLDRLLSAISEQGVEPEVVERLGVYLAEAPAQAVARIRPLALARHLDLDPDAVVDACLRAARSGLLILLWDILCPVCRIPTQIRDTLKALRDHDHCEACGLDFAVDFARSVELIFRADPSIRDTELATYCVGGPAHSPHVVAQVRVAPGEAFELPLGLPEGSYRIRGPGLPYVLDLRVADREGVRRLDMDLAGGPSADTPRVLLAGGQAIVLKNSTALEVVARVERAISRDDALTAARAAALATFRELFPGETLAPGQLVGIEAVSLLRAEPAGAGESYERLGDARAFGLLHESFRRIEAAVRSQGGAVVKAVGDGLLATFPNPRAAAFAAFEAAAAIAEPDADRGAEASPSPMVSQPAGSLGRLQLRAAVHHGPAMVATINDQLDYFGLTVAQSAALLATAGPGELAFTPTVASDPAIAAFLRARGRSPSLKVADLPGLPASPVHLVAIHPTSAPPCPEPSPRRVPLEPSSP